MDLIYYNRISTDNKEQDPLSNLDVCKDWSNKNNHRIVFELVDKGVSGSIPYFDRAEGSKLKSIIKEYQGKGKQIGILVFSIDRFSREHPVRALSNIEDLKDINVLIFSATENIFNEDNEFALPMQFNILWFNYYFLLQHSKKVKAGNEKRRAKGLHVGRALIKEVKGKGENKKYVYYSAEELQEIQSLIKKYCKKHSYRETKKIMLDKHNVSIGIYYISKVMNK